MDDPPNHYVPRPRFEYRPPSLLKDYKYLAVVFAVLLIAGAGYLISAPRKPLKLEPPPVYVEPLTPAH